MSKKLLQESETVELKKSLAELLRRVHMVEAWGRGVPLILEKEPGVQFRAIAKLFITSFDRPSYGESVDKAVVTIESHLRNIDSKDDDKRFIAIQFLLKYPSPEGFQSIMKVAVQMSDEQNRKFLVCAMCDSIKTYDWYT